MKHLAALVLTCVLLLGCAPRTVDGLLKEEGQQALPGEKILSLVKGNTLLLRSFEEDSSLYFDPSGRLFATDISANRDDGKWDVSQEGELCLRLSKWYYGDLRCFQVFSDAAEKKLHLASSSGVLQYAAEQQAGDSKKLFSTSRQKNGKQRTSLRKQEDTAPSKRERPAVDEGRQPEAEQSGDKSSQEKEVALPGDTSATLAWMAKDCPGCNLADADLEKADLIAAKLAEADLHGANLRMANLRRANLQGANLRRANLAYANLPGANLQKADLRDAILKGANLIRADLTGARLEGTDLTDALTDGAKGLK